MTNESKQQIARDLESELSSLYYKVNSRDFDYHPRLAQEDAIKIILSAIERATKHLHQLLQLGQVAQPQRSKQRTKCPTCGQIIPLHTELQRSEPIADFIHEETRKAFWKAAEADAAAQEWTKRQYIDKMSGRPRDSWDIYEGDKIIVGDLAEEECDKLCDAHNAALTAERQRSYKAYAELCESTRTAIAAERQRREQEQHGRNVYIERLRNALGLKVGESLTQKAGEIYQQLLSAQAAIEKHDKHCGPECVLVAGDLSALHQHDAKLQAEIDEARAQRDWLINECGRVGVTVNVQIGAPITEAYRFVNNDAEVREPLVKLLEASKGLAAFGQAQDWNEWEAARDDALAKVKEGK